jgi:hypothetical protein
MQQHFAGSLKEKINILRAKIKICQINEIFGKRNKSPWEKGPLKKNPRKKSLVTV